MKHAAVGPPLPASATNRSPRAPNARWRGLSRPRDDAGLRSRRRPAGGGGRSRPPAQRAGRQPNQDLTDIDFRSHTGLQRNIHHRTHGGLTWPSCVGSRFGSSRTLQNEMNRLFGSVLDTPPQGNGGALRRWMPAMDLVETGDHFVLRADLPGLSEADVNIEVEERVLTISGERKAEHSDNKDGYHRVERAFGSFSRSLTLPEGVDAESVAASFDRGVLEVRIPSPSSASRARSRSASAARRRRSFSAPRWFSTVLRASAASSTRLKETRNAARQTHSSRRKIFADSGGERWD